MPVRAKSLFEVTVKHLINKLSIVMLHVCDSAASWQIGTLRLYCYNMLRYIELWHCLSSRIDGFEARPRPVNLRAFSVQPHLS